MRSASGFEEGLSETENGLGDEKNSNLTEKSEGNKTKLGSSEINNGLPKDLYKIVGPILNPSENLGKSVALMFECGPVKSPIHGDAQLNGAILCFEPFQDCETIQPNTTCTSKISAIRKSNLEGLDSLGFTPQEHHELSGIFTSTATGHYDRVSIGIPAEYARLRLAFLEATMLIELAVDDALEQGYTMKTVSELLKLVLRGDLTLDQLPQDSALLRQCAAMFMLCKKEIVGSALASKWTFLEQDIFRFLQATSSETTKLFSELEDYLHCRSYSSGLAQILEMEWMVRGIVLSQDVRNDPDFAQFKSLICLHAGLVNDIIELQKAINNGEVQNIVLMFAAQKITLQAAIATSLQLVDSIHFRIKAVTRDLLRTFPTNENVRAMKNQSYRSLDCVVPGQALHPSRYGSLQFSYSVVELNKEFDEMVNQEKKVLSEGV